MKLYIYFLLFLFTNLFFKTVYTAGSQATLTPSIAEKAMLSNTYNLYAYFFLPTTHPTDDKLSQTSTQSDSPSNASPASIDSDSEPEDEIKDEIDTALMQLSAFEISIDNALLQEDITQTIHLLDTTMKKVYRGTPQNVHAQNAALHLHKKEFEQATQEYILAGNATENVHEKQALYLLAIVSTLTEIRHTDSLQKRAQNYFKIAQIYKKYLGQDRTAQDFFIRAAQTFLNIEQDVADAVYKIKAHNNARISYEKAAEL